MKVLLIYYSRTKFILPAPPIGLSYVATAARKAGHEVRLLDLVHSWNPHRDLLKALRKFEPAAVGISVRQLDNLAPQRLEWHMDELAELVTQVRGASSAKIILGGPAITVYGPMALRHLDADYAVVGEGEESFPTLLDAIEKGRSTEGIPGVCLRENQRVVAAEPVRMDRFGSSGMEEWIQWGPYERKGGTWGIQTKRGCPLDCVYCPFPELEGKGSRCRPAADVVDEIERVLRTRKPRTFEIVDSNFNVPLAPTLAFCEEIIRRGLKVNLSAMSVNPRTASRELFQLMERSGFSSMMVTVEAANEAMLERLRKGFGLEHLERTVRLARETRIHTAWFLLLGGPGETLETVDDTMRFAETELRWKRSLVIVSTGIRILPGTGIADIALEEKQLSPGKDLVEPSFYFSKGVSEREIIERVNQAIRRNPAIVHTAEETGMSPLRAIYPILSRMGMAPPYWRLLPPILRFPPLHALRSRRPLRVN